MPSTGAVPAITPSYSGLVNGATAPATAPTCSTTATSSSPDGYLPDDLLGRSRPELHLLLRRRHHHRDVEHRVPVVTVTAKSATVTYGGIDPGHHPDLHGLHRWSDHPGDRCHLHHDGHVVEPGRHLPDHLLGCGRSELRVRLRRRFGDDHPGCGDGDGVLGLVHLRRLGPRDHGRPTRAWSTATPLRPRRRRAPPRPRPRARSARTRRPASVPPIRTTPSRRWPARSA